MGALGGMDVRVLVQSVRQVSGAVIAIGRNLHLVPLMQWGRRSLLDLGS